MGEGSPQVKVVPTSRPHLSRTRRWRLTLAKKASELPRNPKAVLAIGGLGSIILAWVIVMATQ